MIDIEKSLQKLEQDYSAQQPRLITDLFKVDDKRRQKFSRQLQGLSYDFSKQNIDDSDLLALLNLVKPHDWLTKKIKSMFVGDKINTTEHRAVLHTALRNYNQELIVDGHNISTDILAVQQKIQSLSQAMDKGQLTGYSNKKINTIVNIGIGGSDLGLVLASEALEHYHRPDCNIYFISSVDFDATKQVWEKINPETTVFIIVSKTFTTQETMVNAKLIKSWFEQLLLANNHNPSLAIKKQFFAVSNNLSACLNFGISYENIFLFWDFVGGRYSIWSAVSLSLVLYIGYDHYLQMLEGAKVMDDHFQSAPLVDNIPVLMALIGIWNINICNCTSLLIAPYNQCLRSLPAYLQQLEMESNGKSINSQGQTCNYQTSPIIWGSSANNAQHAYYQMLHQGTQTIPVDIIITKLNQTNKILYANALAQAQALMTGDQNADIYKKCIGNKPSSFIVLEQISPYYLGMLLALYEHKVFVQGAIWQINSFDQMGVELGKKITNRILSELVI